MCLETAKARKSRKNSERTSPINVTDTNMEETVNSEGTSESNGDLRLHQLAGGNIIRLAPVFSPDGENILLVCRNLVRIFNVGTGAWVRDLEKCDQDLVSISFDKNNTKLLVGCDQKGNVIIWKWRSGVKVQRMSLFPGAHDNMVTTFNVVSNDDMESDGQQQQQALVSYWNRQSQAVKIDTFDLETGKPLEEFPVEVSKSHDLSVSRFGFFATIHKFFLTVGYLRNGTSNVHRHPRKREFTFVTSHPSQPLIATGDKDGQVMLWRNLFSPKAVFTIYHWHATPVRSIAFSEFGSHFYSGGKEFVLVKWTIDRPEVKQFLPRLRGAPVHITLGPNNHSIALALSDNQIQLLHSNFDLAALVQTFTYVHDDETGLDSFPCGIKLHPRSQCLVLNGRPGQLQFYSTQSQSLLYNMEITKENALAAEHDKVIFNTRVTQMAISEDWLVTSECWNDQQHSLHITMKFWRFNEEKQNYYLNTNILMPHEEDLTALELSSANRADNVYCASAGRDRALKLWANNREVYGKGNVWHCVGQRSYKCLPIGSLCFSKDGSVLIVGFGRHIVIFKGNNLRDIRCVLTAPSGLDGIINRIGVIVPKDDAIKSPKKKSKKVADKLTPAEASELVAKYLTCADPKERDELKKKIFTPAAHDRSSIEAIDEVPENRTEDVYEKIFDSLDLDLNQKLQSFNGLDLDWGVNGSFKEHRDKIIQRLTSKDQKLEGDKKLLENTGNIKSLQNCFEKMAIAKDLADSKFTTRPRLLPTGNLEQDPKCFESPKASLLKHSPEIKTILLGSGEFSHLLIVATRNRVLIWNMLTLKIQTILKLSCQHICIDPVSGFIAAFTENNQLFVFPPNCPISVYGRKNMPEIYGALWVPRKVPRTNYSDWQAASQLIFLTKQQELMCFVSDADEEILGASMAHLQGLQALPQTPFGAMLAKQQMTGYNQQGSLMNGSGGALLLRRSTAKELINLLPHAMAPLHILCKGYLGSVLNQSGGADKSRSLGNHVSVKRNGAELMEVDSDSEVEILTPDASESPKSNGNISPGATSLSEVNRVAQQSLNSKVESQLRKIAKVELSLSI